MARTQVPTSLIADETIVRADLNVSTSGSAVIRKLIAGTGITISSTGADAGTGDVTVSLNTSGVVTSFNSRTGAVTLSSADVTGALGFTPISGESDTLASVTTRGATTTNAITVGGLTSTAAITANYGTANRTTQVRDTGLFFSRTSDGSYVSSITADGNMVYGTRNSHIFQNDGTTSMVLVSDTRNVLIGTATDAGYRLDVNGTARVQGKLTISTGGADITGTIVGYSGFQTYGITQIFSGSAFQIFNAANNSKASFQYINGNGLLLTTNADNISGVLKGLQVNSTVVASANNDVLVGLDITPTFTNGAFTGVTNYAARFGGNVVFTGSADRYITVASPTSSGNGTHLYIQGATANTSGQGGNIYLQPGSGAGGPGPGRIYLGNVNGWDGVYVTGVLTVGNSGPNTGSAFQVNAGGTSAFTVYWDNLTPYMGYGLASGRQSRFYNSSSYTFDSNVIIGSNTDAGYKLDVNGTARVQNTLTVSSPGFVALNTANTFLVDTGSNNYRTSNILQWYGYHAGSGTNNTLDAFAVGGNSSSTANASYFFRVNLAGGNSSGVYGASGNNVSLAQLNAPTVSRFYVTAQGGGGLVEGSTSGFLISTITDGHNLSLRSEKGTGGGGGGINYLSSINGSNHSHRFFHNNVEQMRLQYSGNLLINTTTDAGFRLDVNGTARVQSTITSGTTTSAGAVVINGTSSTSPDLWFADNKTGGKSWVLRAGYTTGGLTFRNANDAIDALTINDIGSVSIGNTTSFASSILSLNSTTQGFLQTRMTNTQVNAIATPATGLQAYDTTNNKNLLYDGSAWRNIATETWVQAQGYLTSVATPTLAQVTTSGNTTTNAITVGGITSTGTILAPESTSALALASASTTNLGLKFYSSSLMVFIAGGQDTVKIGTGYFATNSALTFGSQASAPYINYNGNNLLINAGTLSSTGYTAIQTGNLLVGTTTDAGYKLDVNGIARVVTRIDAGSFTPGAGATAYTIATTGRISAAGGISFRSPVNGDSGFTGFIGDSNDTKIAVYINNGVPLYFGGYGGSTDAIIQTNAGFNPSSGTGNKVQILISGSYQTSGTYSGGIRGLYYNPTLTSMTGVTFHRAIETVTGDVIFGSTSGNVGIGTSTLGTATELTLGGSQIASSAIARGQLLNTTLTAAANNDVLVGLDIDPTFTLGVFTGTQRYGLRVQNSAVLIGGTYYSLSSEGINPDSLVNVNATVVGRSGSRVIAVKITPTINANNGANQTFSALEINPTFQNVGSGSSAYSLNSIGTNYVGPVNIFGWHTTWQSQGGTSTYHVVGAPNGQGFRVQVNSNIAGYSYEFDSFGVPTYTLRNNNIDAVKVYSTGNVGINTTTDSGYKLDVNGTARTSQLHTFAQGTLLDATTSTYFHSVNTGGSSYGGMAVRNSTQDYTGYIQTGRSGSSNGIVFFHTTFAGATSGDGHQKFMATGVQFGSTSKSNPLSVYVNGGANGTVQYPFTAINNVNTTNTGVGYLFQTNDATGGGNLISHAAIAAFKQNLTAPYITSSLRFSTISDAANTLSEKMRISDAGNLLIGTTADAGYKLDVNGIFRLGQAGGQLNSTAGNTLQANFGNVQFYVGSSGGESIDLSANSTGEIRFSTASVANRLVVKNSGNVLVGTGTDAGYKFDVSGTSRVISSSEQMFRVEHTNGNYMTFVVGNGSAIGAGQAGLYFNGTAYYAFGGGANLWYVSTHRVASAASVFQIYGGGSPTSTLGDSIYLGSNAVTAGAFTATSGTQNTVSIGVESNATWQPSSGTATYNLLKIVPKVNTSGTYSGIVRGILIDPVLTSTTGASVRAIETTRGDVIFASTSGKVGIGVLNPVEKLEVSGSIKSTSLTVDGVVKSVAGVLTSIAGFTGMVNIQQPAPMPPITLDIQNGIVVNVM